MPGPPGANTLAMSETQIVERELKWRLDADAYRRLADALPRTIGGWHELNQDNRFLDSPDGHLLRAKVALRLRRENARVVITAKWPAAQRAGALHQHHEHERAVNPMLWLATGWANPRLALPLAEPVRAALGNAPLTVLGGFTNHRRHAVFDGATIALDHTRFDQHDDWELEVETNEPERHGVWWNGVFETLGITAAVQTETKFKRWLTSRA